PSENSNRYQSVNEAWQNILEHAIVTDHAPEHTGPIFFGGFSFDPENKRTELWANFPHTLFVIPQYMLTISNRTAWLTTNRVITPEDMAYSPSGLELPQDLLTPASVERGSADVWHKEEIYPSDWLSAVEKAADRIQRQDLDKVVLA